VNIRSEGNHEGNTGGSHAGLTATRRGGSAGGGETSHSWEKGEGPARRGSRGPSRNIGERRRVNESHQGAAKPAAGKPVGTEARRSLEE
ncbi:MAG: hypothetical protein ACR2LS_01410, partial [Thermomicrobiales bacterium]